MPRKVRPRKDKLTEMLRAKKGPRIFVPKVYNPTEVIQKHIRGED